jgi:hypothetical protein
MKLSFEAGYGSHLPILMKVIEMTDGPVVEFGTGIFSTPYLHWACWQKRRLVSYDNNVGYYESFKNFAVDNHEVYLVTDWDATDISGHWSVALIDHAPSRRRREDIARLANSVDYIVVHDTDPPGEKHFRFSKIYPLFKYRKDFGDMGLNTTVLSNFKDLEDV